MPEEKSAKTLNYLRTKIKHIPKTGLILGSGWETILYNNDFIGTKTIPYREIPDFPVSTISGHSGRLISGQLADKDLLVLAGRVHYYEGFTAEEIVYPVKILGQLGIKELIITNAAGGINSDFQPGDIMLIIDHINQMPIVQNLLWRGAKGVCYSSCYDTSLINTARAAAKKSNITLKEGVYLATTGPSYETPAEIRMMRFKGADAVGMSTVPEALAARQMGLKVLGLSCITNWAAGLSGGRLSHREVLQTMELSKEKLSCLIKEIIKRM